MIEEFCKGKENIILLLCSVTLSSIICYEIYMSSNYRNSTMFSKKNCASENRFEKISGLRNNGIEGDFNSTNCENPVPSSFDDKSSHKEEKNKEAGESQIYAGEEGITNPEYSLNGKIDENEKSKDDSSSNNVLESDKIKAEENLKVLRIKKSKNKPKKRRNKKLKPYIATLNSDVGESSDTVILRGVDVDKPEVLENTTTLDAKKNSTVVNLSVNEICFRFSCVFLFFIYLNQLITWYKG